jgi:hypothetical protein
LTDRANGTEIAMVQEVGTVLAGWAPPPVVSPISSAILRLQGVAEVLSAGERLAAGEQIDRPVKIALAR